MKTSEEMKAVMICVGYDDLLSITLPRNAGFFKEIVIGTTPEDTATQEVASKFSNVRCHLSRDFYADGATFNKGRVMEQCFNQIGRTGWMCVLDADIILPKEFETYPYSWQKLTTPNRRMLEDPSKYSDKLKWETVPILEETGWWGYCQVFNASDPVLQVRPWYSVEWKHAGGCDHDFQDRWPSQLKVRPSFTCMHLGPNLTNWFGRVSPRADKKRVNNAHENKAKMLELMSRRKRRKKWHDPNDPIERIT